MKFFGEFFSEIVGGVFNEMDRKIKSFTKQGNVQLNMFIRKRRALRALFSAGLQRGEYWGLGRK